MTYARPASSRDKELIDEAQATFDFYCDKLPPNSPGEHPVNLDDLAEQAAPLLATLVHPGDQDTPPFPLSIALFQPITLPEGMAQEEAAELGLPSTDFGKLFLQALFHMLDTQLGATMIDAAELADLQTAAAAQEHRRTEQLHLHCQCGQKLARLAVTDFDTKNPRVNGPALIKAMQTMNADCGTGHKVAK